ncbi:hypothetical protein EMCRGX_G032636 [Ephydatia muelleri]|eukprot:Em0019g103a
MGKQGDTEGAEGATEDSTKAIFEETPLERAVFTYISYAILIFFGYIADFLRKIRLKSEGPYGAALKKDDLFKMGLDFERFYSRNLYRRVRDCWNRPVCSTPGPYIDLVDRYSEDDNWTFKNTGTITHTMNLGSYNYLGFGECRGRCAEAATRATYEYGVGCCSSRRDLGTLDIHKVLEAKVAKFLHKDDAIIFGMGFATNSTNLPALLGKGSLLVSDELNHASLVLGARLSGAQIKVFKHNNMKDLESVLRRSIIEGQPITHRPWKKILIVVEGIYSMEGSMANLPAIIALKKKYKAYLYIDEAHSIGAMGKTGRGVVEFWGVDPADIDIMMGTFTKSFGSCGGYIAASYAIINHLRQYSHSATYGASMSATCVQQTLSVLEIMLGEDGTDEGMRRIAQLAENARYFRKRLREMGFIIYGNDVTPVVPMLIFEPGKVTMFSREMLRRKISVVVVGFPATTIVESRSRMCLSALHTREMLDLALKEIDEVGDMLVMKKHQRLLSLS